LTTSSPAPSTEVGLSAGRKSSVWLSSISSEAGSDGAAHAPLHICCQSRIQDTPKSVSPFWKSSVNPARVSPSASAISTSEGDLFSERQSGHVQVFGPVLYSHLLKQASEKTDDRAADRWISDLNLPIAEMLPTSYVQSNNMRLEIYGRVARCRSEDDLDDLEEETGAALRPATGRSTRFLRGGEAEARLQAAGIVRLDAGPEAIAATFLPGRLRKVKSKRCSVMGTALCMPANRMRNRLNGSRSLLGFWTSKDRSRTRSSSVLRDPLAAASSTDRCSVGVASAVSDFGDRAEVPPLCPKSLRAHLRELIN
jgi:hypothetical protein